MGTMPSQITSLTSVYSTVYSGADQSKHQSSASLAFVWGIHRGPVNSPHKWPVTRKMFPFDDVIMTYSTTFKLLVNYGHNLPDSTPRCRQNFLGLRRPGRRSIGLFLILGISRSLCHQYPLHEQKYCINPQHGELFGRMYLWFCMCIICWHWHLKILLLFTPTHMGRKK